eukprot:gene34967-17926_t
MWIGDSPSFRVPWSAADRVVRDLRAMAEEHGVPIDAPAALGPGPSGTLETELSARPPPEEGL